MKKISDVSDEELYNYFTLAGEAGDDIEFYFEAQREALENSEKSEKR